MVNFTVTVTTSSSFETHMSIYNAHTGSSGKFSILGNRFSLRLLMLDDGNYAFHNIEFNIGSYNGLQFFRSRYFP